jgi:DNA repair exonuclease SbcCD ATPase subunit
MTIVAVKESKQQLMQAFQQILAERKKLESKIATKQEEAEKAKNQEILAAASTYTVDSIVKGLADLQLEFGSIVNSLSEKLAKENSKLDELNRGIEIATQRLQELQRIRVVADTLDILTQEHQEKLKTLEQDIASKREALEKEIAIRRKEWQKEQAEYEEALQVYNDSSAKERQQEQEEYQYKLETTRKLNTDAYEAKKRNIEREIQENTQQKDKDWAEREKILTERQALFTEYQQKISAFPSELEEAVKKAREEAIKETSQRAKIEADLFDKEWEGNKQSYELKIQALEETIKKQTEQIESVSNQLQAALKQSQDLAMKAFNSSSSK